MYGTGSAVGPEANWVAIFRVCQFVLVVLAAVGDNVGGPLAVFAVFCGRSIPFVLLFVSEARGRSLEDIERGIVGD